MASRICVVQCCGILLFCEAATAHHSTLAEYEAEAPIQIEGVVTEFVFKNPHCVIYFEVTDEEGKVTNWYGEGSAATLLRRRGWNDKSLKTGDIVRVSGDSSRDGSAKVVFNQVEVLDAIRGRVVREFGTEPNGADQKPVLNVSLPLNLPDGRPNLSGTWSHWSPKSEERWYRRAQALLQDSYLPLFEDDETLTGSDNPPPYNQVGLAEQAKWDPSNDPQGSCEPPGLVRQAAFTTWPAKITQNDDHVVFEYEQYDGRRIVYIDEQLPEPGEKSHLGDSIARYEGDLLIIETINLTSNPVNLFDGHRISDEATTIETYRRIDTPESGPALQWKMEITDPKYMTSPWVEDRRRVYAKDYQFIEDYGENCRAIMDERT